MGRGSITILILLCFTGCRCVQPVKTVEKVVVHDSIVQVLRDTTIFVEVEKLVIKNILPDTDTSTLENKYATSMAYAANGLLFHTLEQKQQTLPFRIQYVDKDHTVVRDSLRVEQQTVEINRLTAWQTFRVMLGNIFGVLIGIALIYLVFRIYRKFA